MGRASRIKKERKAQGTENIAKRPMARSHVAGGHSPLASAKVRADMQELFARLGEGNLVVIDGNGVAHGEERARRMYWADVCERIRSRGASCLPEMAGLGRLMNLSIFDVEVPVVDEASGAQLNEDIFTAMFLLGNLDCFQWLLLEARRVGCDWVLLGRVFRSIVANSPQLANETPRMVMTKMMVRFMAESFHSEGVLEEAIADDTKTMGQPFARRIAQDYLEELAAADQRAELDAVIAIEERATEAGGLRI